MPQCRIARRHPRATPPRARPAPLAPVSTPPTTVGAGGGGARPRRHRRPLHGGVPSVGRVLLVQAQVPAGRRHAAAGAQEKLRAPPSSTSVSRRTARAAATAAAAAAAAAPPTHSHPPTHRPSPQAQREGTLGVQTDRAAADAPRSAVRPAEACAPAGCCCARRAAPTSRARRGAPDVVARRAAARCRARSTQAARQHPRPHRQAVLPLGSGREARRRRARGAVPDDRGRPGAGELLARRGAQPAPGGAGPRREARRQGVRARRPAWPAAAADRPGPHVAGADGRVPRAAASACTRRRRSSGRPSCPRTSGTRAASGARSSGTGGRC